MAKSNAQWGAINPRTGVLHEYSSRAELRAAVKAHNYHSLEYRARIERIETARPGISRKEARGHAGKPTRKLIELTGKSHHKSTHTWVYFYKVDPLRLDAAIETLHVKYGKNAPGWFVIEYPGNRWYSTRTGFLNNPRLLVEHLSEAMNEWMTNYGVVQWVSIQLAVSVHD